MDFTVAFVLTYLLVALAIANRGWTGLAPRGARAAPVIADNSHVTPPPPRPAPAHPPARADAWRVPNSPQARTRDRYVAARFPGIARRAADLAKLERVIPAARLFFEEGQGDRAIELLDLATEEYPDSDALRLAQLEIAFLLRDAALFCDRAREFRQVLPQSPEWSEIARLGRHIAPGEPLFGHGIQSPERSECWPATPNWIQMSWDLAAEVLAAEFHRESRRGASHCAEGSLDMTEMEVVS
ncbi:MAG TPA: hypothetical protein VKR38_16990 [Usitatibacter sp.]|nr:hypothetical protein [Usitatibacter sp.]